MPDIKLLNIDCMEFMKDCKDKEFDLAIVDPPYGIGVESWDFTKPNRPQFSEAVRNGYSKYETKGWDEKVPTAEYWQQLFRISVQQIIWGGNYFTEHLFASRGWIFWDKLFDKTNNFSHGELAWSSFKIGLKKFTQSSKDETKGGKERIHPTQKPVKLYKWLLKNYAKEGDKIFDSHGGSMSIAIACHYMNFDLTLCEIDKDYYEAGVKRYNEAIKQQTLFDFNHSTI